MQCSGVLWLAVSGRGGLTWDAEVGLTPGDLAKKIREKIKKDQGTNEMIICLCFMNGVTDDQGVYRGEPAHFQA